MTMEFWIALLEIVMVNMVLSGDNAVVIAMAARNLPESKQRLAILYGGAFAVILRIVLTVVAVELLKVSFLQFVGGLLLLWIAIKLLIDDENDDEAHHAHDTLSAAVKTILIADLVMSLDNTLAIAALANSDWTLLILGLLLSIPIIMLGSAVIIKLINRYPIIIYIGAGLIAYTAGKMIVADKSTLHYLPKFLVGNEYLAVILTVAVTAYGWMHKKREAGLLENTAAADE